MYRKMHSTYEYIEFGTPHGVRHPLEILECIPWAQEGKTVFSTQPLE